MKTLYISDLDGTLLDQNGQVSARTQEIINGLLARGALFTVASARSQATAANILKGLDISLPAVLLNGALLYDLGRRQILESRVLGTPALARALGLLSPPNAQAFVYTLKNDALFVHHGDFSNAEEQRFYDRRIENPQKTFVYDPQYAFSPGESVLYISALGKLENMRPLERALSAIDGIKAVLYRNVYAPDYWFVEAFSQLAGKAQALAHLKARTGAERTVAFGDNFNDLDMLRAASLSCAVSDAQPDILAAADLTIGESGKDGVALFMAKDFTP